MTLSIHIPMHIHIHMTVHVGIWDILRAKSRYMGTPLGPKYIPYTYMDPLGNIPGVMVPQEPYCLAKGLEFRHQVLNEPSLFLGEVA